jgi:hypothetical protein
LQKQSLEVPRDLLDFVSFLDPNSIASNANKPGAHFLKNKKRGRGRPPSLGLAPPSLPTFSLDTSGQYVMQKATNNEDGSVPQSTSNEEKIVESNVSALSHQEEMAELAKETIDEIEKDGIQELAHNELTAEQNLSIDQICQPEQSDFRKGSVFISPSHPLMGVWKGSFNVKNIKGTEDIVEETFFFYSTLGGEIEENLKDLPPEPPFPYCLMKRVLPSIVPTFATIPVTSTTQSGPSEETTAEKKETGITSINESTNAETFAVEIATNELTKVESNPDICEMNDVNMMNEEQLSSADLGMTNAAFDSLVKKVLVGFGRNSIGRFSVAAIYDEVTGTLRCEKKYMTVKYSIKRGRRSHVEYAMNGTVIIPATATPPKYTNSEAKQQSNIGNRKHSLDGNIVGQTQPVDSNIFQTRNRTNRLSFSHYLDDDYSVDGFNKKRKTSAGSTKYQWSSYSGNKSNTSYDGHHQHNTSSSQKGSSILTEEVIEEIIQKNPNAIVGSRNPDNDPPESTFREAFMDCESGEVFEGEWYGGYRHGRGICIYCDGLMYEGQWHRGREHGHGDLMTGDRRVIYSGDWLDATFNGYGTYNFPNGDKYIGDWKDGYRHGRGEYIFQNGCKYNGDWRENKRHGKGRFIWSDGISYYEGDWENDQRHGRGVLELKSGFKYDGAWFRNVMEGKGSCTFPSGQSYQGTFKSGLRDGRGSVHFAEGVTYEGRFKEDRFDGQGTLKIHNPVPGIDEGEILIPFHMQSDLWRIHWKAGFGATTH